MACLGCRVEAGTPFKTRGTSKSQERKGGVKEIEAHLERLWAAYCLGLAPRAVVAPTDQKDPALHVMELRGYRGWRVILTEEAVTLQSLRPRYRQAWTPGVQPAAVHTAVHADRSEERRVGRG